MSPRRPRTALMIASGVGVSGLPVHAPARRRAASSASPPRPSPDRSWVITHRPVIAVKTRCRCCGVVGACRYQMIVLARLALALACAAGIVWFVVLPLIGWR